jgi:hypothetical protein
MAIRRSALVLAGAAMAVAVQACDVPFGLGLATTRALENGSSGTLTAAKSFEMTGSYTESGTSWSIDLQVARPITQHVVVTSAAEKVEAIVIGQGAYFRGQKFLSEHMGTDPLSLNLIKAAGGAWWKGTAGLVPALPDLTDGGAFKAAFLGSAATQRIDHVSVGGIDAVDLSGPRADVYIAAQSPYRLLRVHMKQGVVIDGIGAGDLTYENLDKDFGITAPTDVIDFSNLSTLPPIYTVLSVDTSGCGSPCVVSALIKNLGGTQGARSPSTVTFTMTASASGAVLGTCHVQVVPDVGYNAITAVQCTISLTAQPGNAALVTATADNPGHA